VRIRKAATRQAANASRLDATGATRVRARLFVCSLPAMAASASNIVFDDMFTISAIDKEGKKFDRGPRPRPAARERALR
jgi:hypothetical protein